MTPADPLESELQSDWNEPVGAEQGNIDNAIQKHVDRGLSLYKRGKIHDAIREFLRVLSLDSYDPLGHYLCGVTLQALELEEMALDEWAAASSFSIRDSSASNADWD